MLPLPDIYKLAMRAAIEASRAIMEVYSTEVLAEYKEDGSPVTNADLAASVILLEHLEKTKIPINGEESKREAYSVRKTWKESWCIDPLDGTRMFLKRNGEFSVNIAHIQRNRPCFGIIASPAQERLIIGGPAFGAAILSFADLEQPEAWQVLDKIESVNQPLIITCSRFFKDSGYLVLRQLEAQYGEPRFLKKGSAIKFFDLAKGSADVYLRFGPTMEWDIAAGQAILEALGGGVHALSDNKPLRYNKESLYNPPFIARTKALMPE